MSIKLAIFASGTGSNATKIVEYFYDHQQISVDLILSNKSTAGVLRLADDYDICKIVVDREYFYQKTDLLQILKEECIDYIILAGFLWLIPEYIIEAYNNKIINIHPALLPKYGGKGMYGIHVHRAVKSAGDDVSGPTVHLVNKEYDKGKILAQKTVTLDPNDTPEQIAHRVLQVEHQLYAPTIEKYILEDNH